MRISKIMIDLRLKQIKTEALLQFLVTKLAGSNILLTFKEVMRLIQLCGCSMSSPCCNWGN